MSEITEGAFRVAGFDDQTGDANEPVTVTCGACGEESPWFTYRDDGGGDRTGDLAAVVAWAMEHHCASASLRAAVGGYQGKHGRPA